MAGTSTNGLPFYNLDTSQQDLLLAALMSNNPDGSDLFGSGNAVDQNKHRLPTAQYGFPSAETFDAGFFASPQEQTSPEFNAMSVNESPFGDYLDGDTSFDFDNADGLMIGALPGDSPEDGNSPRKEGESSTNEKRKSPGDGTEDADGSTKRREGEDKTAKKPGRKPLTSEPTTKRKAQNRAAQRAFRERKEKHLKDLETKVAELEKVSDAKNHENGLLRAQVQRLQTELREYRKRLSLNSAGLGRTSPMAGGLSSLLGSNTLGNNFQFEFPRFGGLPGSHVLDNGPLSKSLNKAGTTPATNGAARSISPKSSTNTPLGTFRGTSYSAQSQAPRGSTDSATSQTRVFQFNSSSSSHTGSPSASSNSQGGQNSSCDTSPEPSHHSPAAPADSLTDGYVCHGNSEGEITFCEKLNMACGNPRNPVPRAMSQSDAKPSPAAPAKTPATDINGIDFFASQNGGQFDPTLFGDYREPQNAIVGDGDFTGGFFNEAFPLADFGSPFHFGDTPAVQKPNPLEEADRQQDGGDDEEVVPGEDATQLLNCHKIWDKLSSRADFKDGTIDIDNLCSELRAKARCSENGVVVNQKDVEAALHRLPKDQRPGQQ